ncbi:Short transient receptor potential channel 4-associated protein [Phytophthora cinnamomi]|uniref:Short transient receptor potential channel 4-associated protein n=1 Tax=Phytophthora cinnamomi TaxID=4785 RepID=UPI003559A755|nr:Short transient receptor potential channel 4-associated protein [Phytophthora cinnamomi]
METSSRATAGGGASASASASRRRVFRVLSRMQATGSTASASIEQDAQWRRQGARAQLRTAADLPASFVSALDAAEARAYARTAAFHGRRQALLVLVRELHALLDAAAQDRRRLRLLLQELVQRLLDPNGVHAEDDAGAADDAVGGAVAAERETFLRLGGDECLLRVLHALRQEEPQATAMAPAASARGDVRALWERPAPAVAAGGGAKSGTDASLRRHALNDAMALLRELCYFSVNLALQLCDKDGLIVFLFQLMGDARFFDNASGLVEEILAVREESFDLSRIPNFHAIMQSLSSRQLAFFCRVLALVVFEPEDRRLLETAKVIKSLELLKLRRNRMMRADNIVDRNHALIFNSPLILQRLLRVLQVQNFYFALNPVYEPFSSELATSAEFATLLYQTSDRSDWDTIDRLVTHPALGSTGDLTILHRHHQARAAAAAAAASGDTNSTSSSHPHQHPFSVETAILRDLIFRNRSPDQRAREDAEAQVIMKSIVLAPYRVEVLFVLCTLLNGKRKVDFQERLAEMGLVNTLNTMFDKFQWTTTVPPNPAHEPLHGPGCDCSLDASLKIQFLRLIHNFCDRDYSDNTSKLLLLSEHEVQLMNAGGSTPINLDHPEKGLLSKIIHALIEQPVDSIYRFWLASCVEAFLRRAAPTEQLFVARTPLLQALITEILSGGAYRSQGSFQSAFDLLGEMTKGNWETLQLFHGLLNNTQFAAFMEVVILNLVDSNVFIRSMLLSSEKFAKQPQSGTFGLADDYEMDRMSDFLTVNLVRLLRDLMTIVTMDDINHENICCLNTAIVILVFQHRRQRLPAILEALRDHEDVSGKQGYVCDNFRGLLWFWIQYYTPRGRDRLGLEHSSEVKFEEWRHVVSLLCADDGSSTALLSAPARLPPSPYSRLYATSRERCT